MKTFELKGIDCALCAGEVESALRKVDGLETARINFAAGTLRLNPVYEEEARRILREMEPGSAMAAVEASGAVKTVREGGSETVAARPSFASVRLILAAAAFAAGLAAAALSGPAWVRWTAYAVAYALAGYPVVLGAARNVLRGKIIDELFLMTVASAGAMAVGEPAEAAAVMLFYAVGEMLQEGAVTRSRSAIRETLSLRDQAVRLIRGSGIAMTDPRDAVPGDVFEVLPGEYVGLDGEVVDGETWMDTSALTGESVPRRFGPGDEALAGFVNDDGRVLIRVTRPHDESAVSRVKKLLEEAAERKSPTERVLSRFASIYTPAVVGAAAVLAVIPPLFAGVSWAESAYRAMILLVISCPCALVVSVPLAYFAGIGRASRDRILLRGSDVLDALARTDAIAFDKTGTLTEGRFRVTSVHPAPGVEPERLLEEASLALSLSNHPIARSVREASSDSAVIDALDTFREIKGAGVVASGGGREYVVGNAWLLAERGIAVAEPAGDGSVVHLAVDSVYAGLILLKDAVKPDAAEAIRDLRNLGVDRMAVFTGDRPDRAVRTSEEIGIGEVSADLLPEGKMAALEAFMAASGPKSATAFVGDGMNDAPVILRADVGMAMGTTGTDLAIEAADAVFMDDRLSRIPLALKTARFTRRIVRGNIVFALAAKAAFMAFGAAGSLPLWLAVVGDVGVALVAVLNSLRILGRGE